MHELLELSEVRRSNRSWLL